MKAASAPSQSEVEVWVMVLWNSLIDFLYFYVIGAPKLKIEEGNQGEYISFFSFMSTKKPFPWMAWIGFNHQLNATCV